MTTIRHSHSASASASASSSPKPSDRLPRSPSDPARIAAQGEDDSAHPQQIYVLSADGSSLFLLDPSKPSGNEEPPPYAPFTTDVDLSRSSSEGALPPNANAGPSSPHSALSPVPFPALIIPPETHSRHRASTLSELNQDASPTVASGRPRVRNHSSFSHTVRSRDTGSRRSRSVLSSPGMPSSSALPDENTPLLATPTTGHLDGDEWVEVDWQRRRRFWRAVFCGELEEGHAEMTWKAGWQRFWRPVGTGQYWKAMIHLWFLNFPFALFVWPPLVVGTLAGTALLITLPLGAAVWWLTLFISRSAARLETIMQLNHHSPLRPSIPQPSYHPIFHRLKERSTPPTSPVSEVPPDTEHVWEKRFLKCSYAMFLDHYSYSALSYFLLIKPLIVLFSTIVLWALFPVALVLVFTLPMYLRAARRWGQWQAGVALENL